MDRALEDSLDGSLDQSSARALGRPLDPWFHGSLDRSTD